MSLRKYIKNHKKLSQFAFTIYNYSNPKNRLHSKNNNIEIKKCKLKGLKIKINGINNHVIIEDGVKIRNCKIEINGNNNYLLISNDCIINDTRFAMEEHENSLTIGEKTIIFSKTDLSVIEGTKLSIGKGCLLAQDIDMRTGDSHGIVNTVDGNRINPSCDIEIGDHVWIGIRTTILKGVAIAPNSIVGACSLLNKKYEEPNCVIAGNPAKIVKKGINWTNER